ncbi:MAG: hypothetical protein MUF24_02445 [Chitinophagaceae bacterium]|jgi:hypothetical protein|nr:hypothetical protein [Chitinophagaceae bacterium]
MVNYKKLFVALIGLGSLASSYACDICGCGSGGVFLGMLPSYKKYFSGVRYQYRKYNSHLGSATGLLRTSEHFLSAEWFGGMRVGKKMQLMAFVPYQWHRQQSILQKAAVSGLGDVSVMATVKVLEAMHLTEDNTMRMHTLQVGGGVKLPTGKWRFTEGDNLGQHANFMPGTGSLDWMGVALYQYSAGNLGVAASAMYRLTSANGNNYRFGNRGQFAAQSFYHVKLKGKARITPNAGIMYETMAQDKAQGAKVFETGGHLLNGLMGVELSKGIFAGGMVFQPPIAQNLSDGEVRNLGRGLVYFTVVF